MIQKLKIKELKLLERNPRKITKEAMAKLVNSLDADPGFLDSRPILVNLVDGVYTVYGGNQRVRAAKKLGWKEITCSVENDLDAKMMKDRVVKDNKTYGEFDYDILANEYEIDKLLDAGMTMAELAIEPVEIIETDEDESESISPKDDKDADTNLGDIYYLNNHILCCGDSTDIELVTRIINEKKIDLVYTDPPYGINEETNRDFASKTRACKGNSFNKIIGDKSIDTAISGYTVADSLSSVICYWGGNYYAHKLPPSACWLIWDKRVEENQRDMNSDCELAYVKHPTKKSVRIFRHLWKGMIKASENGEGRIHPTQKPIELAKWCIKELNPDAKIVVDLFTGSGSTLIASESMLIDFIGFELSPAYCDIIIDRWVKYMQKNNKEYSIKKNGEVI